MNSKSSWRTRAEEKLELVYPGNWDHIECSNISGYIVHFPDGKIENSKGMSRDWWDMYIVYQFNEDGILLDIRGVRETFAADEFQESYAHSHLSSSSTQRATFGGFCLGNTAFHDDISRLGVGYDDDLFEAVLYQTEIFLSWESLEAGPYKRMETIGKANKVYIDPNPYYGNNFTNADITEEIFRKLVASEFTDFKLRIIGETLKIEKNDALFNVILPLTPNGNRCHFEEHTGKYYTMGSSGIHFPKKITYRGHAVKYKGRELEQLIIGETDEQETPREYPNPKLVDAICERFERIFTLYACTTRDEPERESESSIIGGLMFENI